MNLQEMLRTVGSFFCVETVDSSYHKTQVSVCHAIQLTRSVGYHAELLNNQLTKEELKKAV